MPELTDDQLDDIRRRHATGTAALLQRIATAHGVSAECVEAIVHGRPWRHLAEREGAAIRDLFGDG